jgi:hypothetical protein
VKQAACGGSRGPVGAMAGAGVFVRDIRPRTVGTSISAQGGALRLILLGGVLVFATSALGAPALAAPRPDPYEAGTAKPRAVAPDPYQGESSAATTTPAPAPDPSAAPTHSYTPPSTSTESGAEPRSTPTTARSTKEHSSAARPDAVHRPADAARRTRARKHRAYTPSPPPGVVRTRPTTSSGVPIAIGAHATPTGELPLASGGVALLALVLASGSLLLLLAPETWSTKP